MTFDIIIWGSCARAIVILIPLYSVFFVLDILRSFLQTIDKR